MLALNIEPLDYNSKAIRTIEKIAKYRPLPSKLKITNQDFWNEVAKADIILSRLSFLLNDEFLNNAKKLKVIVTPTTGLNHIDLEVTKKKGIKVISLQGEFEFLSTITSTAELTLSLMLESMRFTGRSIDSVVNKGLWDRDKYRGYQLYQQKLGIIGMGRLGKIVLKYALALGMDVSFCDIKNNIELDEIHVSRVDIKTLLQQSDIVSLHVNFTSENYHLINTNELSLMPQHSWLINTARGELLNEEALLSALQKKEIGGAALDVLENETATISKGINHPLISYARNNGNLIITPHLGGACRDAMASTELYTAKKLVDYLNKKENNK
jgi:D-3-phosphoglycerate dehydrogenase / 2-oxoglutarate reductase